MTGADLLEILRKNPYSITAGLLVVVVAGILFMRGGKLDELQEEYGQIERLGEIMESNRRRGVELESHLHELRSLAADLENRMFHVEQPGRNLRFFYGLESPLGVSLSNIRQRPVPPPETDDDDENGEDTRLFVPIPFEVEVTGRYPNVLAFVRQLEKGEHFVRITSFQFQKAPGADVELVLLDLRLQILGIP